MAVDDPEDEPAAWVDDRPVALLERRLTRSSAIVGVGACLALLALTPSHQIPQPALLAALGLYGLARIVVLVLWIRARSSFWVANLCEIGALAVVAYVVESGAAGSIALTAVVVLLLAGGLWRRHVLRAAESESP